MKQVLMKKGKAVVDDIPAPPAGESEILVRVSYSCISIGTEMAGIREGGKSLIRRLIEQPRNVKAGLTMLKEQGFSRTLAAARGVLDSGYPTGYSAAGTVVATGLGISGIAAGDRVACAGAGIANHAEFIAVPRNLLVKVPDFLTLDVASTVTLGCIALQGVRRADPKLGETVVVFGLGILGQLTVQMLKANGCRVVGIDVDQRRIDQAQDLGLDLGLNASAGNATDDGIRFSHGHGADVVIVTAASPSSEIMGQAMDLCRKKGRVVIVGDVGLDLKREKFYKKELDLFISTSYGPGRYDPFYESEGKDYPYAYVRWTENRNMDAYLDLLARGKVIVAPLIERTYPIAEAAMAYDELSTAANKPLMVLLEYSKESVPERKVVLAPPKLKKGRIAIALVGAGGFAKGMHLPNIRKMADLYTLHAVASKTGTNAKAIALQYEASYATTDYQEVLRDKNVDLVMIATRHNLHARMAIDAAKAGKAVFVEKPMALRQEELDELVRVLDETKVPFLVGFNRRFSPHARRIKELTDKRLNPLIINYRMNAGFIPRDNWIQAGEGGGRNIGEACHIYDLFNYFTGSEVETVSASSITPKTEQYLRNDNFIATIKYKDGSVCNLIYTSLGAKDVSKEQMDVYVDGKIIQLDDYKKTSICGAKIKGLETTIAQKGQLEELKDFGESIKSGNGYPLPLWQMVQATELSFEVELLVSK
jgi:predicted dehydrogenase/threonine dehydrogenase-like Zn-dependent dehydrogenase